MGGGVDMVVVLELHYGEEVVPVILPFVHKEPEVLILLLIDALRLSIGLRVPCCGRRQLYP